ncbi:MAG: hypothetical protein OEO79_11060 [Gemmatimonadota bacterium]|nr:hypothetical protein [Gemmatimonadota bacterium]MDH3423865.1 hypothetical protein [Gemmatimonadota bacterium]
MALAVLAAGVCPEPGFAQAEISAGLLVVHKPSVGGRQIGPIVSASGSRDVLGLPLFLELGVARTDFSSLGQNYHHNHYLIALGAEWFPTRGTSRLGLRLGLGAYGELETVETDPRSSGGGGWVETVVPSLVLERDLGSGRRLVARIADSLLGPWFAVLDPSEYDVEHRFLFMLGIRF